MNTIKMSELTWPEIKEAIESGYTTVVVGSGSSEQHGPHLPEKTDAFLGEAVAHEVALRLGKALLGPMITLGCSDHHLAFAGTVSLKKETFKAILFDYVASLVRHGFKTILFVPFHGGNYGVTREAIDVMKKQYPSIQLAGATDILKMSATINDHAGEGETSIFLSVDPSAVRTQALTKGFLGTVGKKELDTIFSQGMPALTVNGILGDATQATAEKGKIYFNKLVVLALEEIQAELSGESHA